ncbi:hypothetical protein PYH56_12400 (plasmid) [Staphylococcus epidermidis]|uniref:hypothetical protein n=1 Tax=Staphylococcus epidermidis TaxID=1282 RepID=UPI0024AE7C34|nr:hypothetical protein [Staphylococcus epidermidis]WHI82622.1 hypothetical protein PYH56_12400 [Staphylococcus epidermidis]
MANETLKDSLKNLEFIQESVQKHNSNEFYKGLLDSQKESALKDDIQRMIATTADNIKSVINDKDLTKDDIIDYVNKVANTQLDIAKLINSISIKK